MSSDDPEQVQRIITSEELKPGPEVITVDFPVLNAEGAPPLRASELVWQTPPQAGGEQPFQIWRLSAAPPFGWRAVAREDIDCQGFGETPAKRAVAMLGIAIPAQGGPSEKALALNLSELISRETAQEIFYTHSTNRASGGAPVFDLATRGVFAVHVGSAPDPARPGFRRGEGYSLHHLIDMARSSIKDAKLGPVCAEEPVPASPAR